MRKGGASVEAIYVRLRAILCSEWGCTPAEIEDLAEGGRIALEDVVEAVLLRARMPFGGDVFEFVFREKAAARKAKLDRLKGLVAQVRATTDEGKRAELMARIDEINRG